MDNKIQLLLDIQKETMKLNLEIVKAMKRLYLCIVLVIAIMIGGFLYYINMFEYSETTTETTETTLETSGESSSIDYDNVEGNQYNDNATHTENGGDR